MLESESKSIGKMLSTLPVEDLSPCLNLGSSTEEFRRVTQPFIEADIIVPCEARGARFIHADMKEAPGVDITGDILDPAFEERLGALRPGIILCCNILEHVLDREKFSQICARIVRPDGYVIVSVPQSFPYHLDPIDTYFRPMPTELVALFPDFEVVAAEIVTDTTYGRQLARLKFTELVPPTLKGLAHFFVPFYKWQRWKSRFHPMLWLFHPYSVSIVLLKKPAK